MADKPKLPKRTQQVTRSHPLPVQQMRAAFEPSTIDADKRTVQMTWTTGARVLRGYWDPYYEELSLDPSHVRMGRLQSGAAPLLNAHNSDSIGDVIGVVESARLDAGGKTGSATVRFDDGPDGEDAFRKVRNGILRNVSVGYRTYKMSKVEDGEGQTPVYRAVDWEPYELSMVPIGADAGAATRAASATNLCEFTEERAMDPDQPTTTQNPTTSQPQAMTDAERGAIVDAEIARGAGIRRVAKQLGRSEAEAEKAIADKVTLDKYRELAIEARAAAPAAGGGPIQIDTHQRIEGGGTGYRKWASAVRAALLQRCGSLAMDTIRAYEEKIKMPVEERTSFDAGEYRGMRVFEVARECLARAGVEHRGMGGMDVIGYALTTDRRGQDADSFFTSRAPAQSIGDFPLMLENVMHKLLLAQYGITPDTWRSMCTIGSAVDFRPNPRYRMGSLSALSSLNELGEFTNKALSDVEKQSITVATKGNILSLSRQLLLNDDMSALARVAMLFGRSAALSIETDFYASLGSNAGMGPLLFDGNPMFFARASGTNIGTGSPLGSNALDGDRVVMKSQKDPSGNELLDIPPAILLVPATLGGQARQIVNGQYDFDALTKAGANRSTYQIPNQIGGVFRDVIDTARLTGTRRYLFADPAVYPCFEVIFLDGQQQPYMEMRQGWRIDGVEWKIRMDYAVGGIDSRGAVTNAGA